MKHIFEIDEKCTACKGTGLFQGMGERSGVAVVCHTCHGTGCFHYTHTYEDFVEREVRSEIKRVIQTNPGICVGEGGGYTLPDFGGMTYEEWATGKPFVSGMEMRKFTCPCWWYQSTDSKKSPSWDECRFGRTFSHCDHFADKDQCWARWDKEFGGVK
jgi:hypothetical protein